MYLAVSCRQNGFGYFSLNNGARWQWFNKNHRTPNYPNFPNFTFDRDGVTLYSGSVLTTQNNSIDWQDRGEPTGEAQGYMTSNAIADPYRSGLIYLTVTDKHKSTVLMVSANGGASWDTRNPVPLPVEGYVDYVSMYFDHENGDTLYAILSDQMITSMNHGKLWQKCAPIPATSSTYTRAVIDPRDRAHLYLATRGEGVLESRDACGSWASSSKDLSNPFVNTLAIDTQNPDILYAGTDGGAFISTDSGKKWNEIRAGLLGSPVINSLAINPKDNILFATTPNGLFQLEKK